MLAIDFRAQSRSLTQSIDLPVKNFVLGLSRPVCARAAREGDLKPELLRDPLTASGAQKRGLLKCFASCCAGYRGRAWRGGLELIHIGGASCTCTVSTGLVGPRACAATKWFPLCRRVVEGSTAGRERVVVDGGGHVCAVCRVLTACALACAGVALLDVDLALCCGVVWCVSSTHAAVVLFLVQTELKTRAASVCCIAVVARRRPC